jgi:hypothetical protein
MGQLEILQSLDMRGEYVKAGITVIKEELRRIRKETAIEEAEQKKGKEAAVVVEKEKKRAGLVFLFTGYMISNASKKENHFPPEKEMDIKDAINAVLNKYQAGPEDLAVTTGMDAGSEIIFVESCAERGIPVQAYFPQLEAPYVRDFVSPGGDTWVARFYQMRNHPLVDEFYQPERVGLPKEGDNVHERNNRWALYSALTRGIDNVRLIAVWDGKGDLSEDLDARLVKHMVDLMRDTGGMVEQIHPGKLARVEIPERPITEEAAPVVPVKAIASTNGSKNKPVAKKKK